MNNIYCIVINKEGEKVFSIVEQISDYEEGRLTQAEVVELFQQLLDTGVGWTLQGSYGRMAIRLIEQGLISDRT